MNKPAGSGATPLPTSPARFAPRLAQRVGRLRVCITGLALVIAGLAVLARLDAASSYWLLLGGLLPLGAGMGLAMTPATTAITDALPLAQQGVGSAMNDLARELGGALGIAVLGSVLQATYRAKLTLPSNLPDDVAAHARSSLALASRLGAPVASHARAAFADGMSAALVCAAIVVGVAGLGVAALLGRDERLARSVEETSGEQVLA